MKVKIDPDINTNEEVTIAVNSSGIKITNKGDWLNEKWKVRKGYLKMHIAVDVKTGKILSLDVTKEDVHDNIMFREQFSHIYLRRE